MTTDDKPAPFPIGPSDAFNGVPWKKFCAGCRAKLDAAQRSGSTTADICGDCAAMLFENGRVVKTEFSGGASPDITSVPIEFIGVTHVVGDEPVDDYRTTFGIVEVPVERSHIRDLRVTKIKRVNVKGFAELTIAAACLDPSPNLHLLKAQIEAVGEIEAMLRWYPFDGSAQDRAGWYDRRRALLARIDAAADAGKR